MPLRFVSLFVLRNAVEVRFVSWELEFGPVGGRGFCFFLSDGVGAELFGWLGW